jgi:hypothetical protein
MAVADLLVNGSAFHLDFHSVWVGFPSGYNITAVERVVDDLVITPIHETRYTVQFAQRVRIWGEPIPEPSTIVLFLMASAYCAIADKSAGGRPRRK